MPHSKRPYYARVGSTRKVKQKVTPHTSHSFESKVPQPGGGHTKTVDKTDTPSTKSSVTTSKYKLKKLGGPKMVTLKPITGNASFVMIAATVLYLFAFWQQIGSPIWNSIWTGKPNNISGKELQIMVGGIVFVVVLTGMASFEETSGVATVTVMGLWGVYLVMNGKQFVSVLNWLQGQVPKTTGTNSSSTSTASTGTSTSNGSTGGSLTTGAP